MNIWTKNGLLKQCDSSNLVLLESRDAQFFFQFMLYSSFQSGQLPSTTRFGRLNKIGIFKGMLKDPILYARL